MIPKEHGAWGMLITTFLIGAFSADTWNPAVLFFGGASLSYFLLRAPLLALKDARWQKSYKTGTRKAFLWFIIYSAMMAVFGIPLFLVYKKWPLFIFFALSLPLLGIHTAFSSGDFRSVKNELVSFAALSMTAPLAYYVATNELALRTFSLYIVCFLYYSATIFYVKMNVTARLRKNELASFRGKLSIASTALMYQCGTLFVVLALGIAGCAPPSAYVAFLPSLWKTAARALKLQEQVPIKKLGWMEVLHGTIFAVLTVAAYRPPR